MTFAHWKTFTGSAFEVGGAAEAGRGRFTHENPIASCFVVDIPEHATRDEVVKKLIAYGVRVESTDGIGFEEEWPEDLRNRFESGRARNICVPWFDLN